MGMRGIIITPFILINESLVSSLYITTSGFFLVLVGSYLLLILLTIVKLVSNQGGPLKASFKNEP